MEENKKLNPFIRIKGDAQRGRDVIEELLKRGGENLYNYHGSEADIWYFISPCGQISTEDDSTLTPYFLTNYEEIVLPRWRAKEGEGYWYVNIQDGVFRPFVTTDDRVYLDNRYWKVHNYFQSEAEAQEKADAINAILQGGNKL